MSLRHHAYTFALIILGLGSALAARALGMPLPFMIGPLCLSAMLALLRPGWIPQDYGFPNGLRLAVMTLIGVAIGSRVTPQIVAQWYDYLPTLLAMLAFVPLAHLVGYQILRRLGRYPRADAFYAAAPGGFIESIAMSEASGADVRVVATQQFLRVIVVILLVPTTLSLYLGQTVGSSAGATLGANTLWTPALPLAVLVAALGFGAGTLLRLPARQLTGPLFAAAILTGSGWAALDIPAVFVSFAQIIVGVALGLRFMGSTARVLIRAVAMSFAVVTCLLSMCLGLALLLHTILGMDFIKLVLIFAPGGLTEMGLIALTLSGNPAVVVVHHVVRILAAVTFMGLMQRIMGLHK